MYIYICKCTRIHIYTHTHVHLHIYTYIYMYITPTHIYIYIYTHIYTLISHPAGNVTGEAVVKSGFWIFTPVSFGLPIFWLPVNRNFLECFFV